MNIKELMVGDLLRVNRDGLCIKKDTIVQIRGIDGDNKFEEKGLVGCAGCQPLDETQFAGGIWLDYLSPIPITPDILQKNGFQLSKYGGYEWRERLYGCMGQSCSNTTPVEITYDEGHCVVSNPHIGIIIQGSIDYVHELQHALLLCRIGKGIIV